ncbi:ribosomal RNA small subunit methyltransferase A [Luteitalea sp. TBR-22]|uniref:16S rRNA (adenine(1518)-N(6)/adenine(1519)-N(6))- dimethyltransferase RsmA n=1 Tax=Luteitalea sp. TBR-22 TaxID=2802971 RepID=UPI001AF7FE52|nr:16S rRNA (adenine(1518)-N(6)/adenine(1519)-N(6))-dimethyltransferase RsmA [Luteitalea sp. TBR-22]BCS33595.1 ribosomal RNA small subunit methyltransferase A [Luteitalea sp. TBR-22]
MQARKRFGQHFLEPAWIAKIVAAVAPKAGEVFLEVGPGRGQLTEPIARTGAVVHAVEIDRDLVAALRARAIPGVHVHEGDFLDVPPEVWFAGERPYRMAANLPYNVSTPILGRLLRHARAGRLADAFLMLQKEVADRLVAVPGTRDYGPLAIAMAQQADVSRVLVLPPGAFRPPPKVHSAVVRMVFRPDRVPVADPARLDALVRHVFTQRRKMLSSSLGALARGEGADAGAWLRATDIDGTRRPETLTLEEFARLADASRAL